MNPVLRADLRYRLGSSKALTLHTVFLSMLALLTLLSLPPELGRLEELRQQGFLPAFLVVSAVLTMYFASACACGEIVLDGEKSVWDLAASPLPAQTIATGKILSGAAMAALQVLLASPFAAVVAGIRGESMGLALRVALIAVPAATALGALSTLYSAVFDSDFARSFAHWATLLVIIVGANALPRPWNLLSPVRAVAAIVGQEAGPAVWLVAAAYALAAVAGSRAITRRIERIRREARVAQVE